VLSFKNATKNFILVLYEIDDFRKKLFEILLKQLDYFYPKSIIHIITNIPGCHDSGNIIYHFLDISNNLTAKLEVYGLLKEPSIYIDWDILLMKQFSFEDIASIQPITFYAHSGQIPLQNFSKKRLAIQSNFIWNSGIVLINSPSPDIVSELKEINEVYFSDLDWLESQKFLKYNDEYALTYFVTKYKYKINESKDVNVSRYKVKLKDIDKYQSVHYTGTRNKALIFKELSLYPAFT